MPTTLTNSLRSAELLAAESAEAIYQRHRVPGTQDWFRHDVKVYRLTYATRDVDGTEITASGAQGQRSTMGKRGKIGGCAIAPFSVRQLRGTSLST